MGDDRALQITWNEHEQMFFRVMSEYRNKGTYTDATIACEGKFFSVHKLILSMCSDYFKEMFDSTPCKCPVIVLRDIDPIHVEHLLDYMYLGHVLVKSTEMAEFMKVAKHIGIKGMSNVDESQIDLQLYGLSSKRPVSKVIKKEKLAEKTLNRSYVLATPPAEHVPTPVREEIVFRSEADREQATGEAATKITAESGEAEEYSYDDALLLEVNDGEDASMPELEFDPAKDSEDNETELSEDVVKLGPSTSPQQSPKYSCDVCERGFTWKSSLVAHKKLHKQLAKYKCTFCDYHANTGPELRQHAKQHTAERSYLCEICPFSTKSRSQLVKHVKNHANDSAADATPSAKRKLAAGKKHVQCDLCTFGAVSNVAMSFHKKIKHKL